MRPERRTLVAALLVLGLLALPPLANALGNPYLVTLTTRALIYALAAMALDLIMGYGRLVSFGHAAFLGLGAYTVGILNTHALQALPLVGGWAGSNEALVVWPLAMLVAAAYALPVGAISLRTSGVYFIMITLAFGQLAFYLFNSLSGYGGQDGLSLWLPNTVAGVEIDGGSGFYYLCLAILLAVWALLSRVVRSPFGRVLVGCRENPRRMRALGFRPYPYQLAAFVLSAALTGLAGALLANQQTFVSPALMHWSQSGELLVLVLLGGLATLIGPIWGALALLLLEELLVTVTEHWQLVLGPLLVLVVLFFRNGLQGALAGRRPGDE